MIRILYHGSDSRIDKASVLYFTPDLAEAREFAVSLDDIGHYNPESYIYRTEIDTDKVETMDDFEEFDSLAYQKDLTHVVHNPETGWYIVPNPRIELVEHYKNEL